MLNSIFCSILAQQHLPLSLSFSIIINEQIVLPLQNENHHLSIKHDTCTAHKDLSQLLAHSQNISWSTDYVDKLACLIIFVTIYFH